MALSVLFLALSLLHVAQCQNQIFFPRGQPTYETFQGDNHFYWYKWKEVVKPLGQSQSRGHQSTGRLLPYVDTELLPRPPCIAYSGKAGVCRLLVQCATFFAEIAELSRSPCVITKSQQGVCCPPNKQQTKDPSTLVPVNPPLPDNRKIVFPKMTQQDLNEACQSSLNKAQKRILFTDDLVNRNIVAPPGSPVYLHSRLFETTDDIFNKGQDATVVLQASKDLMKNFDLSKEQSEVGLQNFSVLDTIIRSTCPPGPSCPDPRYSYRTMDGSCNNIQHTDWGKTGIAFNRMVLPEYEDGILIPRLAANKKPLPSARHVSTMLAPSSTAKYENLTINIWQWGQFLDHDITHTPISKGSNKTDISCCNGGQFRQPRDLHPECFPISIPPRDPFYSKFSQGCMEFVRSMPAIRPQCKFGTREQMNQITSYIDASNVYGSTHEQAANLRSFQGGLLKVSMHGGRELLPGNNSNVGCVGRTVQHQCFVAGDTRVNEQPDLAVMHIIWFRQHNKVAHGLASVNPGWSDEVLYQEARRIVAAQMQHITYNEYLPIVLGREFMETFGLLPLKKGHFRGYRSDVDATIMNAFATAAFRYGHTLITDTIQRFGKFGNLKEEMEISKTQFVPFSLYEPDTLDTLIRGLSLQKSQKFDRFFSEQLTNKLFAQGRDFGMDLVALNIQRGRDHGLAPYTKWRRACGLSEVTNWNDLLGDMDSQVVNQLSSVYSSVDDVDLFVGGVSERITPGTLLGPTFLCIIGRQFIRLKIGDRFYYENGVPGDNFDTPGSQVEPLSAFTEAQLDEIRKSSLARIMCDNSDNVELMQPLAFVTAHLANKRAACATGILIPKISLDPWLNSRVWAK